MDLSTLKSLFADNGCSEVYVKALAENDNSKNQIYVGGSFEILNMLPVTNIEYCESGEWEKERFKANLDFAWLNDNGQRARAPHTKLILYPKYPEVRLSGFLLGCKESPSEIIAKRASGRLLFISVDKNGTVLGYVTPESSLVAAEFKQLKRAGSQGVFTILELFGDIDGKSALIRELCRIHKLGWIDSKRLSSSGSILSCNSSNCGGYTLEAELGITPNGISEPDYKGWELKQFGVKRHDRFNASIVTLMTPEPTGGFYKEEGTREFILKYGYPDKRGRTDRKNFGGIHKIGLIHPTTGLELKLVGYDAQSNRIRNTGGYIALVDESGIEAASWSFTSLMQHWNRKHGKACFVPSVLEKSPERRYSYGKEVLMGTGTDFVLFLNALKEGHVYYDPGIKIENLSTKPKIKKRSQFRIKTKFIEKLYHSSEFVDVCKT